MNANELADELEDCEPYNVMDTHLLKASAAMLRQQLAEIEKWQGLTAEEIATIPNDEFRLQKVEKILKERNTHPAKTLTDEEIINIADTYDWHKDCAIEFARAILRKAQK